MALKLMSASFTDGDYLGNDHILSAAYGFGCAGGNLSPQLSWSDAPAGTQSVAVTCFDPDAPWERLLALGRGQYPAGRHFSGDGRRGCWWASLRTIASNSYNQAAGRYKPQVAERPPEEDPAELIREVLAIEREITAGLEKLLQEIEV